MGTPQFLHSGIIDVIFGDNVKIVQPVNLYGCSVGDGTFIGPFVEIQRGVKIGKRCRIQSHTFICELVTIDDDCFISHGAMFINDIMESGRPSYENPEKWRPTNIGRNVAIGTNATILPVNICHDVLIGAGAVVTKDIEQPGIYVGNPAKMLRPLGAR